MIKYPSKLFCIRHSSVEKKNGIPLSICKWIEKLLSHRVISVILNDTTLYERATRGCLQGGVLSPLLWSIIADGLLEELDIFISGYIKTDSTLATDRLNSIGEIKIDPNMWKLLDFKKRIAYC